MPLPGEFEAVVTGIVEGTAQLGSIPHHFLWHTPNIDTCPAKTSGLDNSNTSAVLSRTLRGRETTTTSSQHDEIVITHGKLPD